LWYGIVESPIRCTGVLATNEQRDTLPAHTLVAVLYQVLTFTVCRAMVSKQVFESAFWECYDKLTAAATEEVGVPGFFRFVTLLGELHCSLGLGLVTQHKLAFWHFLSKRLQ
jgi:hypothetical protein